MNFCRVNFLMRRLILAGLVTGAASAPAQQTIQFTKPVDQDLSGTANAFMPTTARRNSAGAFNAPSPLFGEKNSAANFDILPGGPNPGAVSPASAEQWRKFLDGKKNWMLMTPEEVMGIPTPEKILGLTDPKEDPKMSAEERFLQRQERLSSSGATNGFHHPDAPSWSGDAETSLFRPADANTRFAQTLGGTIPGADKTLNPLFNPNPNSPPDIGQKAGSVWANPFGMAEPLPKPTPDQLAGMDRFRALMEPSVPEKAPEPARFALPLVATPDPNLQALPAYNPAGRSFSALESGIGRPMGLTPLPGLTGPRPVPAKKSASLVQPPPWLSDGPQPLAPVPRTF